MKNVSFACLVSGLTLLFLTSTNLVLHGQLPKRTFTANRVGMMQSVDLPSAGELYFSLGHRFASVKEGLYTMFGLDAATIRLGFDYGITDRIEVGLGRNTFEKTYDLFSKMAIAKQSENGFPLSITGNLAASFNTIRNFYPADKDNMWYRMSFSAQLIMARRLNRFSLQASPLYFRNNFEDYSSNYLNLFAIPMTAGLKLSKRIALNCQFVPVLNKPDFTGDNPLSVGLDINTGGHQFQLLFTNNTGLFEKAVLTDTQGSWKTGNIFFGFNLVRVFYLKDDQKK